MKKREPRTGHSSVGPEVQLSLFDQHPESGEVSTLSKPAMIDLLKDRFENTEMSQEEYRKWIRYLVNASFKTIR